MRLIRSHYDPTISENDFLDVFFLFVRFFTCLVFHRKGQKKKLYLTETINILIILVRSFFTDNIVVITSIFPMRPQKIKTNANIAPINVACLVGCAID